MSVLWQVYLKINKRKIDIRNKIFIVFLIASSIVDARRGKGGHGKGGHGKGGHGKFDKFNRYNTTCTTSETCDRKGKLGLVCSEGFCLYVLN